MRRSHLRQNQKAPQHLTPAGRTHPAPPLPQTQHTLGNCIPLQVPTPAPGSFTQIPGNERQLQTLGRRTKCVTDT